MAHPLGLGLGLDRARSDATNLVNGLVSAGPMQYQQLGHQHAGAAQASRAVHQHPLAAVQGLQQRRPLGAPGRQSGVAWRSHVGDRHLQPLQGRAGDGLGKLRHAQAGKLVRLNQAQHSAGAPGLDRL